MKDFTVFLIFCLVWALAGRAMLAFHINPVAVAIVWLIGFVWGVGYIIAGKSGADRLSLVWLGTMAATAIAALAIAFAVS